MISAKNLNRIRRACISAVRFIFLAAFAYILLYPVFYMLSNALRTTADYIDPSVVWLPKVVTWQNIKNAFIALDYIESIKNTVVYEMISALIEVFVCAVYAYGLSRFNFKFKKILVFVLVLTILLPDVMLMLPRMVNFRRLDFLGILGWISKMLGREIRPNILGTPLTFYLPSLFGVGLKAGIFIFIYMQFFSGLPKELEEAAYIDGAGPLKTFLVIIIPSAGVAFLTVFIFSVIWHWNDYYLSMMYNMDNKTLAVMVHNIQDQVFLVFGEANGASPLIFGIPPAACLLFIIPPVIIYMILQRKFMQSIDSVGIVG